VIRKNSLEEFASVGHEELWSMIDQNCFSPSFQGNASKLGHERFLPTISMDHHLETFSWAISCLGCGFVLASYGRNR
jgi:hypothetical protein